MSGRLNLTEDWRGPVMMAEMAPECCWRRPLRNADGGWMTTTGKGTRFEVEATRRTTTMNDHGGWMGIIVWPLLMIELVVGSC